MPEYLILTVYKSGKYYKPVIYSTKGKQTKTYKVFTASEKGLSDREQALEYGRKQLIAGRFV